MTRRPSPFGKHARVTETRCPDLYNARPGDRVGHATILANSGAKLPGKSGKRSAKSAPPWGRVVSAEPGKVVLAFSLPVRLLSPNAASPGKWRPIARAKKAHRAAAAATVAGLVPGAWERATMRAAWFWPDLRRRDPDNAAASLKAYQDGLVEGGLLAGDDTARLTVLAPTFDIDRDCPRVILTMERKV